MNFATKFEITFVVCSLIFCAVHAWGSEGHQIVATIAQGRLTKEASSIVNTMTSGKGLAYIAPLPDDYDHTSEGEWSSPCHYVNLPEGAAGYSKSDCTTYCVVESINNQTARLKEEGGTDSPTPCNLNQDEGVEPCALEYLVHFVGDIHQPLHVSYASDAGGNSVTVYWFGTKTNLHTVWDTKIISSWTSSVSTASNYLEGVIESDPSLVDSYLSSMDPTTWADESYYYTETTVYNYTTSANGEIYLDDPYFDYNLPIVQDRLIAGGVRLAQLLNELLVGGSDSKFANEKLMNIIN